MTTDDATRRAQTAERVRRYRAARRAVDNGSSVTPSVTDGVTPSVTEPASSVTRVTQSVTESGENGQRYTPEMSENDLEISAGPGGDDEHREESSPPGPVGNAAVTLEPGNAVTRGPGNAVTLADLAALERRIMAALDILAGKLGTVARAMAPVAWNEPDEPEPNGDGRPVVDVELPAAPE